MLHNTQRSEPFKLSCGTSQGCPLSPLLFAIAIAIELLSLALKIEKRLKGIYRWGTEHKVSLYADDFLLYVSCPSISIPHVISTLDPFTSISGYKLKINKSECFPVNHAATMLPPSLAPFILSESGFKYLAITWSFCSLQEKNLSNLTATVKSDLQRWSQLPLSLAGRAQWLKW